MQELHENITTPFTTARRRRVPSAHDLPDALNVENRHPAYLLISDFEALDIYRKNPSSDRGEEMLQELLRRHRNLLRKVSWKMANRYSNSNTFDDFMQHAYVGAIIAYNRFDISKATCKLSNYVHITVENYLLDAINHDSFIQCPSHKRSMRSYLAGRYDGQSEKKKAFELKNNLTDEAAIAEAREKYRGLTPEMMSIDMEIQAMKHRGGGDESFLYMDLLQDESTVRVEENLVEKLDIERAIRQLNERQQMVCQLVMQEEYTNQEAAAILSSKMNQSITEGMVRSDIRAIRNILKAVL